MILPVAIFVWTFSGVVDVIWCVVFVLLALFLAFCEFLKWWRLP
jgi:hypothetical protein